jgi:hypothetical protein
MWYVVGDARYGMSCQGEMVEFLCENAMRYSSVFSSPVFEG